MSIAYFRDTFCSAEEAKLSLCNRGFLYGDGVFTTVRVHAGRPLFLESHLKKLREQCEYIHLQFPQVKPDIIEELITRNGANEGAWRLKLMAICAEDEAPRRLPARSSLCMISLSPYEGIFCRPVKLCAYPFCVASSLAKIKSLAYLERLYIKEYAHSRGVDEALVFTPEGVPLETAFANVFWKDAAGVYFPHPSLPYYEGVVLDKVKQLASQAGYKVHEERQKPFLEEACVYICNAMTGVCPVEQMEGKHLPCRDGDFEKLCFSLWERS